MISSNPPKKERFTEGMTFETFERDEKTVDAVLRNFEVIGEAAKNVPMDVREDHDEVPWSEMAGMHDKLIHGYSTIDLEIIWTTIEQDVSPLLKQVETVRSDIEDAERSP